MKRLAPRVRAALAICALLAAPAGFAAAQTPLLEVEDADGRSLLQVNADAGLLAGGVMGTGAIPATGIGTRFMWHPGKAALRAGYVINDQWDDANVGPWSVALGASGTASGQVAMALGSGTVASGTASVALGMGTAATGHASTAAGERTVASGRYTTALGFLTTASETSAIAMGQKTAASGVAATAMGGSTTASGDASLAAGRNTVASGNVSTALGAETAATGQFSTAMGHNAEARGEGSFAFGDASSSGMVVAIAPNQFVARAAGGFRFLTSANLTTGCDIDNGNLACTGTVSGSSSAALKHDFEAVDPEAVLERLAALRIQQWRYLADTADIRHIGPTAEDFHQAFGLGANERTITMVDADGVNMLAVQALNRRTAELRGEVRALREELNDLLALVGPSRAARGEGRSSESSKLVKRGDS